MGEGTNWWRRPRVVAAALCVALGVGLLAAGPALWAGGPVEEPAVELELAEPGPALDEPPPAGATPAPAPPAEIVVYVSGAVAAPDVYRLPEGARVKDAVLAAGGMAAGADPAAVNLAAPLADAQHVHIPEVGAAPAPAEAAAGETAGAPGAIDLNTASAAALEELPGIGATLAARIVAHRESNGPFASVEGLREVTGIGEKLYDQIAPLVTAGG